MDHSYVVGFIPTMQNHCRFKIKLTNENVWVHIKVSSLL